MRDPNRIDAFCSKLAVLWKENVPDWRFMQLIMNLPFKYDPFYMEDDKTLALIEDFLKREE